MLRPGAPLHLWTAATWRSFSSLDCCDLAQLFIFGLLRPGAAFHLGLLRPGAAFHLWTAATWRTSSSLDCCDLACLQRTLQPDTSLFNRRSAVRQSSIQSRL